MNSFLRLICSTIILGLWGCQGVYNGQALAQCNMTCAQHFEFCKQNCVNNCPICSYFAQRRAEVNFAKYVHEQKVKGKRVMRELNSYRDPLQCRKVTCDCLSDLENCKKGCTGVIPKKLQALPYCV